MDSSSAVGAAPSSDPQGLNFTFVAGNLGCGNLTATDELACMKKVNQSDIEAFLKSYQDAGTSPSISFTPIVDNVTRFDNYTARALAGNFSKVVSKLPMKIVFPVMLTSQARYSWNQQQRRFITNSMDKQWNHLQRNSSKYQHSPAGMLGSTNHSVSTPTPKPRFTNTIPAIAMQQTLQPTATTTPETSATSLLAHGKAHIIPPNSH